jgi:hypothetical protein
MLIVPRHLFKTTHSRKGDRNMAETSTKQDENETPQSGREPLTEQYRPHAWDEVIGQDKFVQRVLALAKRGLADRAALADLSLPQNPRFVAVFVAGEFSEDGMSKAPPFRVGKVIGYRRGQVWNLCYHENGRRRRPLVGPDKDAAH